LETKFQPLAGPTGAFPGFPCSVRPCHVAAIAAVSTTRQPLQNIIWLLGERLARALVTATVLGVVARHLQPEGFGRLNFAMTVTLIAGYLANLGLEGIVVNELIRRPTQSGAVLGTACLLRLAGGLLTVGLVALLAGGTLGADAPLVMIVALGLLFQPVDVVDLWFQRHLESRRTVVVRTVGILGGATLKLWLVATGASLSAFAWAQVADAGLIALGLTLAGWRSPQRSGKWTWDPEIARALWQRGAMLAVSTLAVSLAMRLDQILVRQWLGDRETGLYFAATRLSEVALFAGSTMALSLFPALAASHARSAGEYAGRLQVLFDALSLLGWGVALGCTGLGWLVVRLIYGPAYAEAGPILVVQGWACLFALNATARWQFILLSASPVLNLAAAALHIGTVFLSGWWLLPRLGGVGAAGALLIGCVISGVLSSYLFPSLRECAGAQIRGLLIPFTPGRWRALLDQFNPRTDDLPTRS
jgi:PST family polysaccharide transporter